MDKLQQHTLAKKAAVNGWDLISGFFGVTGGCLIMASCIQPKAPINQFRLPAAFLMMAASVGAERLRENDLVSLDKAIEYHSSIKSERIRRNVIHSQILEDLREEDQLFAQVPQGQWPIVAQRLGINPPNYEMRQPQAQRIAEPEVQGVAPVAVVDRDPCADGYDPEASRDDTATIEDTLIFANQVEQWFSDRAGLIPDSLIAEWRDNPGMGIQIKDGVAEIVRRA